MVVGAEGCKVEDGASEVTGLAVGAAEVVGNRDGIDVGSAGRLVGSDVGLAVGEAVGLATVT